MKTNHPTRPIGVWCLATDGTKVPAKEWKTGMIPQGVLVVTEQTAFIVGLHATVALQFGAMDKTKSPLIQDKDSYDSKAATDAIIAAYAGTHYEDNDDKIWDVYGAPAAEWCRRYEFGNLGAGSWDLPTVAQLKTIHAHRNEINDCLMSMDGYRLAPGWYWSSIEHSSGYAWHVKVGYGDVHCGAEYGTYFVRAVSAFQF